MANCVSNRWAFPLQQSLTHCLDTVTYLNTARDFGEDRLSSNSPLLAAYSLDDRSVWETNCQCKGATDIPFLSWATPSSLPHPLHSIRGAGPPIYRTNDGGVWSGVCIWGFHPQTPNLRCCARGPSTAAVPSRAKRGPGFRGWNPLPGGRCRVHDPTKASEWPYQEASCYFSLHSRLSLDSCRLVARTGQQ